MKIFVIEPDQYYHPQLREWLSPLGEIFIHEGRAGVKSALLAEKPDAVITELLLPELSGYELLAHIQKTFLPVPPAVIIFSRVDNVEDIKQCLNLGAAGYLIKGQHNFQDLKNLLSAI